jgi:hypothetical protein
MHSRQNRRFVRESDAQNVRKERHTANPAPIEKVRFALSPKSAGHQYKTGFSSRRNGD